MNRPAPISVTPAAADRIKHLVATQGGDACGIRLAVKTAGCSGLTYKLDFARDVKEREEVVELDGCKLVVDPDAVMFLLGTEMDFVETKLGANFTFRNPNEKARCGCGESFTV
ncbi:MAG: iron-sulfur cluster assembly accessory protein [Geminicoccaceae bacterium]|nr:MAG: iron-sulfur cluster assembly accessory protein [Geminicoccaceae bacterium]